MTVTRLRRQSVEGSIWKGIGLAVGSQCVYFLMVHQLPWPEARALGDITFALLQFGYIFPMAIYYQRRGEDETSQGIILTGVISLFVAAGWFGYAAYRGTLPSLTN
jgi:hypothetical protein